MGRDVATVDVPNLPLPDPCHRFVACQRSSSRPEAARSLTPDKPAVCWVYRVPLHQRLTEEPLLRCPQCRAWPTTGSRWSGRGCRWHDTDTSTGPLTVTYVSSTRHEPLLMCRWGRNRLLQFGRISFLDPAKDGYVVHLNAAVQRHEFGIAITDGKTSDTAGPPKGSPRQRTAAPGRIDPAAPAPLVAVSSWHDFYLVDKIKHLVPGIILPSGGNPPYPPD